MVVCAAVSLRLGCRATTQMERYRVSETTGRENWRFDTKAVHGGYSPDPTTKAVAVPIYQTVAYAAVS